MPQPAPPDSKGYKRAAPPHSWAPALAQAMDQIIPSGACALSDTSPPLVMLGRPAPSNLDT